MDFNNLLSQISSIMNTDEKKENKPSGQSLCFYPDDFSNDFPNSKSQKNVWENNDECKTCEQNPLSSLLKLLPFLALFKGGKKVKTENLISQIASLSPEFSKFEPLIKLLSKSEEEKKLPSIDSYKKIEQWCYSINVVINTYHKNMKTIVLTGGGTAGHVMPNLALVPELKKHFDRIVYIGSNGIEKDLAENEGLEFYEIPCVKFIRSLTIKNFAIPFKLVSSIKKAKKILIDIKPNIIFSKGGYVSIPVAIAGKKLGIPVLTHESDLSLGLANKIISHYSKLTLTAFEKTAEGKKGYVWSGTPIRNKIMKGKKENLNLNLNPLKKTVLFFGGSLGSKAINEKVLSNLEILTRKYNVLHITGKGKLGNKKMKDYFPVEYTNEIENFFASADMIVSRAGANSIFEILALKKPALLIPLPKSESRGDQIDNAKYFAERGMCHVLFQEEMTDQKFLGSIANLEKEAQNLKKNIKENSFSNPNKKIVEIILKNAK